MRAAALAAAVAAREPAAIAATFTENVRLRALLPGGPIEDHGAADVTARFVAFVADFDTVEVQESADQPVGDRLLLHYRLLVARSSTRRVCTQTAIAKIVDGRLAVINLLCSGFREIDHEDVRAPAGAELVG